MKEKPEADQEITEKESGQVNAGMRSRRASTTDVRQTRQTDGTGGIVERTIQVEPI